MNEEQKEEQLAPSAPPAKKSRWAKRKEDGSRTLMWEIISWLEMVAIAVVCAFLLNNVVIVNASIPTGSMMDTIPENSRVVAFRWSYAASPPKRFDVVVFKYPDDEKVLYCKRVIGLPGETLEIRNGFVYIGNDEIPLDDSFTRNNLHDNYGPVVIPEGSYFMMGDNRNNSADSRAWVNAYLAKEKILGKVLFIYYPHLGLIK